MSGDISGLYSPTYTVEYYDKMFRSYSLRSGVIPFEDKEKFVDYITQTVVLHGGLAGPLSTLAAYFSKAPRIISGESSLREKVKDTLHDLDFFWVQMASWLSAFMYHHTCVIYFPKQIITMKCDHCGEEFNLNDGSYEYPFRIKELDYEQDNVKKIRSSMKINPSEKRKRARQLGVACECPDCGSDVDGVPTATWAFNAPGRLTVLNPKHFEVRTNSIGEQQVVIDPKYYKGPIKMDEELDWFDLKGMPWNLICTYAAKDRVYIPDEDYYFVMSLRHYVGVGDSGGPVAPVVSSVSDTISMDIYKMGNEGLALSKINPMFVMSPSSTNHPAFEGMSMGEFRDFMLMNIKMHQERDINRIVYSPMPVQVSDLSGDGKRFMHAQEIVMHNNLILAALGISPSALDGNSGFTSDPVKFDAWNGILDHINGKWLKLIDKIMMLNSLKYYKAKTGKAEDRIPYIWIPKLTKLDGMETQQMWELVRDRKLPIDEVFSELGFPEPHIWRQYLKDSLVKEERHNLQLERAKTKLMQTEMEKDAGDPEMGGAPNMHLARQVIMQEAEELAMQLIDLPHGDRRSYLSHIQDEDYITYCVVLKRLEALRRLQGREQGGEAAPPGAGM